MGRLFIDNEHDDVDDSIYYYCRCCKETHNNNVEVASAIRCTCIECEGEKGFYLVFLAISPNNVILGDNPRRMDIFPDTENKFILLDTSGDIGAGRDVYCRCCGVLLGHVLVYHPLYEKLFFIKKNAV